MRIPELDTSLAIAAVPGARPGPVNPRKLAAVRDALRSVDRDAVREVMVEEYERRARRRLERELQRCRPRPVQCFSCKRWKPRPSSVCGQCGDDPVSARAHMDPTPDDRQRFDEAYYGERVL